jgi:hypothetical protein
MRGERPEESRPALCECSGPILLARQGRWWRYVLLGQHMELLFDLCHSAKQRFAAKHEEAEPQLGADVAAAEPDVIRRLRAALAALSVYGSRGYRLVVAGNRPKALQVQLRAEAGFTYFLAPTVWQEGSLRVSRSSPSGPIEVADLTFPPGDEPEVVLFEAVKGATAISARMDDRPVGGDRYHLGRSGAPAQRVPLALSGPPTPAELLSEAPPAPVRPLGGAPGKPADWGIWVWLPTSLAGGGAGTEAVGSLPTSVEDQLRALGYID